MCVREYFFLLEWKYSHGDNGILERTTIGTRLHIVCEYFKGVYIFEEDWLDKGVLTDIFCVQLRNCRRESAEPRPSRAFGNNP